MIKLNDNNIFIGEIKQLLKTFNLPNCLVLKNISQAKDLPNNTHFINKQDGYIYLHKQLNNDEKICLYVYGKSYLNLTTNLEICNLIYDKDTHNYLRRYLRFIRDYKNVNLMSLYNCFNGDLSNKAIFWYNEQNNNIKKYYLEENDNFLVYSIPVDLLNNYTISLNCDFPVEMCLTIDDPYYETENSYLETKSYVKTKIQNNYLYTKLIELKNKFNDSSITDTNEKKIYNTIYKNLIKYRKDIKLLIQLPKSFNKGISVLEGDFVNNLYELSNYLIYYPYKQDENKNEIETKLKDNGCFFINHELLSYKAKEKTFVLSDKLIEYLTGNVITPLSEDYDILKLQKQLVKLDINLSDPLYGIWTQNDLLSLKNFIVNNSYYFDEKNISNKIKKVSGGRELNHNYDLLGYCDKEVEEALINKNIGGII